MDTTLGKKFLTNFSIKYYSSNVSRCIVEKYHLRPLIFNFSVQKDVCTVQGTLLASRSEYPKDKPLLMKVLLLHGAAIKDFQASGLGQLDQPEKLESL